MNLYSIYCRKSSESEDRQVLSIESQTRELVEISKKHELQVVLTISESKSAKNLGRQGFEELIKLIESGQINSILVWHPDRLSRNPQDAATIISLMDSGKLIEVRTPTQTFRNNPMDKFMLGFFMMQAKFENDHKGENVKEGLKTKAEKGWLPSGAKAGYMNDKYAEKGSKTILVDPDRYPLIRKAWDSILTGTYSVIEAWRLLNSWGYLTPKHKRIGGKPMSRSHMYKMFTDPFYYGEFEYPTGSGIWHQGKHQPMITRDEFDKVQRLLGKKGRPRPRTRSFDYAGLLECGECHAMITAEEKFQIICSKCKHKFASQNKSACPKCNLLIEEMKNPTLLHYVYYHCTKRKNPNCTQKSIRVEALDKEMDKILERLYISERFKDWAIKYLNEINDQESEENVSILRSLQSANEDIETRLNNLLKLKISPQNADGGLLSDEDYRKEKERLSTEKKRLNEKLGGNNYQAEHWRETAEKTFDFACHARSWFANGDRQTKREILAGLGSNVELYDRSVRINLEKPLQFIEVAMEEEQTIAEMFEPKEKPNIPTNLEAYWATNLSLLPLVDVFRNREIEINIPLVNLQTLFSTFQIAVAYP